MKRLIRKLLRYIWTISLQKIYIHLLNFSQNFFTVSKTKNVEITSGYGKGIRLLIPADDHEAYSNMINGDYEAAIIKTITPYIKFPKNIIWDIGAHFGYQSLIFSKLLGNDGRVVAFEPNPYNIQTFKENLLNNFELAQKILLEERALSDKSEILSFRVSKHKNHPTTSGGYLLNVTPPLNENSYKDFITINTETTTIDLLIEQNRLPIPHFIKIDVEGAELNVLKGASNFLKNNKPLLIIEIHTIPMMFHVQSFLQKNGYQINMLDEEGDILTKNIMAIPVN